MKALLSIFVTALYMAFSIGLYEQVHECFKLVEKNTPVKMSMDCHSAKDVEDECCSSKAAISEKDCCSDEDDDACCSESIVSFQIDQPQEVSKSFLLIALPSLQQEIDSLVEEDLSDLSKDKYLFDNPPPILEDVLIEHQRLTYYG